MAQTVDRMFAPQHRFATTTRRALRRPFLAGSIRLAPATAMSWRNRSLRHVLMTDGGVVFGVLAVLIRRRVPFRMHKFRAMRASAEQEKAAFAASNEGAGPVFRLQDELPQVWDVPKGEMSVVGPRPPLPDEVASDSGHAGRRRHIKPGLTGLWQINGPSNLGWDESVRRDLSSVENWSVTGDPQMMWRTVRSMIQPEGAY